VVCNKQFKTSDSPPIASRFRETFLYRPVHQRRNAGHDAGKHGIAATQSFVDPAAPDDGDLSRPAQVFVPEPDYDRAFKLFYAEREDEL
jgi:hypothetical protein